MDLSPKPTMKVWPETHYVFVEKKGPFQKTAPESWKELHAVIADLPADAGAMSFFSQYKVVPDDMTYRAGVAVKSEPATLPAGTRYEKFAGGNYACFTLKGPYAELPEACGYAFDYVSSNALKMRDNWNLEHYVTDPKTTPQDECVTEILIPVL